METNEGKRWIELLHEKGKLEGTRVLELLSDLFLSYYVFEKNYQEVYNAILLYEQDLSIWSVNNRSKFDAFQLEFLRLFHNYLAGIFSLIEHTRAFCINLNNTPFSIFYEKEKEKLKLNGCVFFLPELRIFTQHRQLPLVNATFEFTTTNMKNREGISEQNLVLSKEDLFEWTKWSKETQEYLEEFEKEINLKEVTTEYQSLISAFYKNIRQQILAIYSKEIEEVREIETEMIKLQKEK